MNMRTLISILFITGCASKGFQYPGPLKGVGAEPPPYADQIQRESRIPNGPVVVQKEKTKETSQNTQQGVAVAKAAATLIGQKTLVVSDSTYRFDCSGLVAAAYTKAGVELSGNTSSMHALAKKKKVLHKNKVPDVGDMVFFDNTWDRNGNGLRDDSLTHIGIVEKVDADATITLVHLGSKGVVRIQMNLKQPSVYRNDEGKILNSYLRRGSSGERLSGQLWVDFASVWDADFNDSVSMDWMEIVLPDGPSAI